MPSSAYLSLLDDGALLGPAIASIAPRVDEIVVVDGAYAWMAPFFTACGRDPACSPPSVRDAMAPWAHKTRWITGVWDNELHKRAAGYGACRHRWIWRVDADEIHRVDEAALDRFLASGHAVGEMEIPLAVTPGLIRARAAAPTERTSLLFDSRQIDAWAHLAYLWLVAPAVERDRIGPRRAEAVAPEPIALTAHLSNWRTPAAAAARARFYVLNYWREQSAVRPGALLGYDPQAGFGPMLQRVSPAALMDIMLGHAIVAGLPDMAGFTLRPMPLPPAQQAALAPLYAAYLAGLAALNAALAAQPRWTEAGDDVHIDLTTAAAAAPFERGGALQFRFDAPLAAARAILSELYPDAPFVREQPAAATVEGGLVRVALPPMADGALRRVLRLAAWPADGQAMLQLRSGV